MADDTGLKPTGDSHSWTTQKANQVRIANLCIGQLPASGELKQRIGNADWAQLPASVLTDRKFWQVLGQEYTVGLNEVRVTWGHPLIPKQAGRNTSGHRTTPNKTKQDQPTSQTSST